MYSVEVLEGLITFLLLLPHLFNHYMKVCILLNILTLFGYLLDLIDALFILSQLYIELALFRFHSILISYIMKSYALHVKHTNVLSLMTRRRWRAKRF